MTFEKLTEGRTLTEARAASLHRAIELGADAATLIRLRDATRLYKRSEMILPMHRFETLSRGRGWCGTRGTRRKGPYDTFADSCEGGYLVTTPGRWVVGGSDGYSRKGTVEWDVESVQVGPETWMIAS